MKNVFELNDVELENCFDGSTDVDMVREIIKKPGTVDAESGLIDCEVFAEWFAYAIKGYIDAEENTPDWQEAWDNNWDWGNEIAESINDYLQEE